MTDLPRCTCGAAVRWVLLTGGGRIAVDPDPTPTGTVIRVRYGAGQTRYVVLTGDQLPAQTTAWRQHQHRPARTRRRCDVCTQPLDPAAGTRHPGCDPAPRPAPATDQPEHEQEQLPL